MADIASLGIKVTTEGAKQAAADLTKLADAGKQAATGVQTAGDAAKKAANSFKSTAIREQREELSKLLGQIDPTVAALGRLDAMEQKLGRFRKKGLVDTDTFNDASKKIAESRNALSGFGNAANKAGLSAKQLAFATRGLPAQFTDIAVSLQAGQRPLSVLLQQGGQLKDIFGGVGPAIRAMGTYVLGLINPFTVAAAAVAALGFAWNEADQRANGFNRALALTGLNADITADKLAAMAANLDQTTNVTQGKASDVLAQVAATGKFTADQIELVARAAINLEDATGRAIDKTVKDFASLKGDPVEAILALNDAMGDGTNVTHFLTQETISQIEKLKEQGHEADATALAMKAMADGINTRTPEVVANLGFFATAWRNITKAARETGDEAVGAIGRMDKALLTSLPTLQRYIAALPGGSVLGPLVAALGAGQKRSGFSAGGVSVRGAVGSLGFDATAPFKPSGGAIVDSKAEREAIAFKDRYLTREENKKKAIAELDRLKTHYTAEEYKTLKAGIEERFKEPKGPKGAGAGIESATARQAVQAFEDELKKEQGLIANQTQVLEANFAARNITVANYYAEQKRLAEEGTDAQVKALEGEISALSARNVKGKVSIENATQLAQKEAELAKVREDGATKLKVLNIQEAAQLKQRKQLLDSYNDALFETENALKSELDDQVLRISVGEREYEIRSRITQLYRQEAKELRELARARAEDPANADLYDQQAKALEESVKRQVEAVRDGYDAMAEAQKDWTNGALKAFADYNDAANDVAGQTYSIFSNAFSGLEDIAVDFFTKGKADWKGYLDSIAADITRFVVRQQLSKLFKKFMPGGDQEGGNAAALSGAATSLAASAGPLYGAAAALSASAAALAAAGVGSAAAGATSGSSSGSGGWFSTLLGLFASNGGGRALGGPVAANSYYQVGENNRPEILQMHGKQWLIPGDNGKVVPMSASNDTAYRGPAVVNQTLVLQGRPDSRTPDQYAQAAARGQNRVTRRN